MTFFLKKNGGRMSQKIDIKCWMSFVKKIVDVICETFVKKHYCVRCIQSKNGHIYFIVRKKEGGCWVLRSTVYIKKSGMSLKAFSAGFAITTVFWCGLIFSTLILSSCI